jgi:hypothetical protein
LLSVILVNGGEEIQRLQSADTSIAGDRLKT